MISDLLHHLETQIYGARWDLTKGTEGAGKKAHQATFHHLSAVLANQGSPTQLKVIKCDAHLQKGLGEESGKLQSCQPDLGTREGHGADHLDAITQHMQDNQRIRPRHQEFVKGKSFLTNLISFCDVVTHLAEEGKAVDVVYRDFTKAFDIVAFFWKWLSHHV
ncbi:rna-directed dna polymerase from mobile element jockey-like [Pitangus sulphuratus]|nr:rna-directed dna polymerase from mobile element jockey-like [Pitangus sulphuratus]